MIKIIKIIELLLHKYINYDMAVSYTHLFNKGIAFLTIIIYTRILTAYDYGIINTFSSWVGILSMILGMSLQNSIRVAFVDFKEKIDDFLSSIISLTLIVGMFLSVLILSVCVFIRINTCLLYTS